MWALCVYIAVLNPHLACLWKPDSTEKACYDRGEDWFRRAQAWKHLSHLKIDIWFRCIPQ